MLTITERIPDFDTYESFLGYDSGSCLFFDIETTGFSPASAIVFLIGTVSRSGGGWLLTQYIAQSPEDEPALLEAFFDSAAGCDTLIHFNGSTFDLPFLRERARLIRGVPSSDPVRSEERLCAPGDRIPAFPGQGKISLDLYQRFRPLKRLLGLPRMNQTSLEQFLGWPRVDRLTGKHMISLFWKYVSSREQKLCDLLLLHNHDDLLGMTDLLRLCAYAMLFDGRFLSVRASAVQLPAESTAVSACTRDLLELRLTLKAALPKEITLSAPCPLPQNTRTQESGEAPGRLQNDPNGQTGIPQYTLAASGMQAVLSVPGYRGELCHFFPNYRDYYYLPLEGQAIHKSVAAFVDREYRVPADPSNCCIKKSGLFFPQSEEIFPPAFRLSYESKELFFACQDLEASLSDQQALASYAASLLRLFPKHAMTPEHTC